MSEQIEATPTKTLEQHQEDLNQWLKERGLVPVVTALIDDAQAFAISG